MGQNVGPFKFWTALDCLRLALAWRSQRAVTDRERERERERESEGASEQEEVVKMAMRTLRGSHQLRYLFSNPRIFTPTPYLAILQKPSVYDVWCKVSGHKPATLLISPFLGTLWIHSGQFLNTDDKVLEQPKHSESIIAADGPCDGNGTKKRKKLKGKRAVVRWLKFLRWKKKKEYKRMTEEEKILYKLRKAQKKEERLVEALKKIEPKESLETTHDPEILTPEEHFYFLKMGIKCKNYVPVGRRGIYQGVILNMHLHWKKHQTLKVVVKTFSPEEVKEIAAELARLSGGIVLDIQEENTIIMYRGKNYSQPPTEIMSPRSTLPRKKALDKSKYRDALRAVRKCIPRLEQDLELLQVKADNRSNVMEESLSTGTEDVASQSLLNSQQENSERLRALMAENDGSQDEDDSETDLVMCSDSEDLSDIFETDSDTQNEENTERPLYLDQFQKFPAQTDRETEGIEELLQQAAGGKDEEKLDLDEVDQMFLRAASLLKKKRGKS
ncbi:uncharacterized CRM domain-containing protein At3g25440, chloroplastic isoform X2 [Diospyros lotus]|uniref:uncharacterized CRM domain-containing protein At3g25440, chloroplastic isoform X2 n=1 Tax=Diospyros lotus TaxID=55363 RepID=UPI0022595E0B|nr:uncharacterized CRM domain-containing protein At3g25440, chloroplastic isoform X2 [Diospyros lotus]